MVLESKAERAEERNRRKGAMYTAMKFEDKENIHPDSNPLHWSVDEVVKFLKSTDCARLTRLIKEQDRDGQSLLMMTLPTIQQHLVPRLGPAVKLCHQIERLKIAFFQYYV